MSLFPSLFVYNFFEALCSLYVCHLFDKNTKNKKFEICDGFKNKSLQKYNWVKRIAFIYGLGIVNLFFQYLPLLAPDKSYQFIFMVIISLVISALILYYYTKHKYSLLVCFYSSFLNICAMIFVFVFAFIFKLNISVGYNVVSLESEFIANAIVIVFKIIVIFGVIKMKKIKQYFKKFLRTENKNSHSFWWFYEQPKPKLVLMDLDD